MKQKDVKRCIGFQNPRDLAGVVICLCSNLIYFRLTRKADTCAEELADH